MERVDHRPRSKPWWTRFVMTMARRFWSRLACLVRPSREQVVGPPPEVPTDELASGLRHDTIAALLDHVRILVAAEEERQHQIVSRGASLVGFASIGTAVLAVGGSRDQFPSAGEIALGLALASLVVCVLIVVLGIFATRPIRQHGMRQIRLYADEGYWKVSPARAQKQMLDSLIRRLDSLRSTNRDRATAMNRAALAIVVATACASLATAIALLAPTTSGSCSTTRECLVNGNDDILQEGDPPEERTGTPAATRKPAIGRQNGGEEERRAVTAHINGTDEIEQGDEDTPDDP